MLRNRIYRILLWAVGIIPLRPLRAFLTLLHRRADVADAAGFSVFPLRFYNPFPEPSQVDVAKLQLNRNLPGLDTAMPQALQLLEALGQYRPEMEEFLNSRPGDPGHWSRTFPLCDSAVLFAMLRHLKPRRYVEIGCGYSSHCSTAALAINRSEGSVCQSLFIEPYPPPYLLKLKLPGDLLIKKIQDVPLGHVEELEAGDVLFIDTSHVIKAQNDVEWELLYLLPLLKPGVIVCVHDIFTPYDYPEDWLIGTAPCRCGNNEQYALECVLSANEAWEVILPLHLIWREAREPLRKVVPIDDRPSEFWFKKIKPTFLRREAQG